MGNVGSYLKDPITFALTTLLGFFYIQFYYLSVVETYQQIGLSPAAVIAEAPMKGNKENQSEPFASAGSLIKASNNVFKIIPFSIFLVFAY